MGGFIIGSAAGQFAGSWAYWQVRDKHTTDATWEPVAALIAGLVAAAVATAIYIPFGVHIWLGGEGTSWGASAFLGASMGICQGVLFRGRPWRRVPRTPAP